MASIVRDSFGKTKDGEEVERFTFVNKNSVRVQVITYGAIITSVYAPDKSGNTEEITLGFDDIQSYEEDKFYFGAIAGRVCGRIANGEFTLDGRQYNLPLNCGEDHLHGGIIAFSKALWTPTICGRKLTMRLVSEDGDEGYPGTLTTDVTFELTDDNEFCIETTASTSKPTPVNITYHPYFNLAPKEDDNIYRHKVTIFADHYVVINDRVLPTGEVAKVDGTLFDLRQPTILGPLVPKVSGGIGFDNCFCLRKDKAKEEKQLAARAEHGESGRVLEVYTTKPGLNFYNAYYSTGVTTRGSHVTGQHSAVCFETQHYPDSVHHPNFPSIIIEPGIPYRHSCSYKFGVVP